MNLYLQPTFKLNVANPTDWYGLFDIQYYEHLQNICNIIWSDVYDKSGNILLEIQTKVADLTVKGIIITTKNEKKRQRTKKEQSPTDTDESLFDETIPSKKQTYSLTLYHTANTILIQGNTKSIWVTIEFPLMKAIIKRKCNCNTSITDAYNQKQPHQTKYNKKMMT